MRLLVDAQLPRRLVYRLREAGHDAKHTLDLPAGNRTTDSEIVEIAAAEERVVVTKDADFVNAFVVWGQPRKLLLISTGNITNRELERLFLANIGPIAELFEEYDFVELDRKGVTIHS
jgi:predicted nuclease of predicted toxin-antitoxin system